MSESLQSSKSPQEILQNLLEYYVDQFTQHYSTFTPEEVKKYLQDINIDNLDTSTKIALSEIMSDLVCNFFDTEKVSPKDRDKLEELFETVYASETAAGRNALETPEHEFLDECLLSAIFELRYAILVLQCYGISEKEIIDHLKKYLPIAVVASYININREVPEQLGRLLDEETKYRLAQETTAQQFLTFLTTGPLRQQKPLPMEAMLNTQTAAQKVMGIVEETDNEAIKQQSYRAQRNHLIEEDLFNHFTRFLAIYPNPSVFAELLVKKSVDVGNN